MKKNDICSWSACLRHPFIAKTMLVMKLTIVLLTAGFLNVYAEGLSQNISFSGKNVSLEIVFSYVKKQTGCVFLYSPAVLKSSKPVTVNAQNVDLTRFLADIFRSQPLDYSIEGKSIFVFPKSLEQRSGQKQNISETDVMLHADTSITIRGRVVDGKGEPIASANVLVKGTTVGSITDANGNYSIKAPAGGTLVFSYVDFLPKEIAIKSASSINVVLEANETSMNQVIVVGYGTQKKVNVTGAVGTIDAKDIQDRPISQTSQALQGKVAGVTVTQNFGIPGNDGGTINVRGIGTLGNSNPLVLIDGVEGDINLVNPQDIENISILKDAASSSIYGSRAANGVILVTTKRGLIQPPSVSYNGLVGFQVPTNLPKIVDGHTYMNLKNENERNSNRANLFSEDNIQEYLINRGTEPYFDTDWYKVAMKSHSLQQSNDVSVRGGSEKISGIISFGNLQQDALIDNTKFNRQTFRFNTTFKANDKLSFNFNGALYKHTQTEPSPGTNSIFEMMTEIPPLYPALWANGEYGEGWNGSNPLALIRSGGSTKLSSSRIVIDIQGKYAIADWLDLELRYAPKFLSTNSSSMIKRYDYRRVDNSNDIYPRGRNRLTNSHSSTLENFYQGLLRANKDFGENKISLLLGAEAIDNKYTFFDAARENYILEDFEVLNAGDEFYDRNSGIANEFALLSYFSRVNYSYKGKYLAEANLRYDGSSRFAKNNRWGTFPSFSLGWRIDREDFMDQVGVFTNLKLRVSWGRLGNQNIGNYPYQSIISINQPLTTVPYSFGKVVAPGGAQIYLPTTNISWETTEDKNLGLDFGFLRNRLTGSFDLYKRTTFDILYIREIPSLMGLKPSEQNVAKVQNIGWDLQLSWNDKINKFSYGADFVLSDVRNKVLDLNGKPQYGRNVIFEGQEYLAYFGYENMGIYRSEDDLKTYPSLFSNAKIGDLIYKDLNGDGKIDNINDKKIIGSSIPRFNFGLSLNMSFKGFDLNLFLQGVGKKNLYSNIFTSRFGGNYYNYQLGRLVPEDPSTWATANWPRLQEGDQGSANYQDNSFYLFDASYIRCRNITLGYNIPAALTGKLNISAVRVFLTGRNMFTIDKLKRYSIDPESPDIYMYGTDFYPNTKVFAFGMYVKF